MMITRFFAIIVMIMAATPALADLQGDYIGCVTNNGVETPIRTTFNGGKRGSYVIYETGSQVRGQLKLLKKSGASRFEFGWKDKYGTGVLSIRIKQSGKNFSGQWRFNGLPGDMGNWTGVRSDKKGRLTGCSDLTS